MEMNMKMSLNEFIRSEDLKLRLFKEYILVNSQDNKELPEEEWHEQLHQYNNHLEDHP